MFQEVVFVPVATLIVTAIMVGVGLLLARIDALDGSKPASQVREMDEVSPMRKAG